MIENKHTPEPWSIDPDDRPNMHWNNHIVSDENPNIAICFMAHDGTEQNECGEANARRIVACVNACAGIPTDMLEAMPSGPASLLPMYARLEKQRDELLAKVAAWEQKAANWMASPEAAQRLDGYRDLAQRLNIAEQQRDDLLAAMNKLSGMKLNMVADGIVDKAIARAKKNLCGDSTNMVETSVPAIVFYPAGSLGEEVHP